MDFSAFVALVAAVLALLLPGAMATAPLRVGLVARVALAGAVGVALWGATGVVGGLIGVRIAPWQVLVPALVLMALAFVLQRRLPSRGPAADRVAWPWLLASWIGSGALIVLIAYVGVEAGTISQTYDNVFHLSAIAHILETGDASSLTLRTLIETDRSFAYYPAGWHTLVVIAVQLTGVSVPAAVIGAWGAVCVAVWIPGVAWLAQVLLRRFEPGAVALVAMPVSAAFGAMPYALLAWGTIYPTFLATAALPAAIALPVAAWRARRSYRRRERPAFLLLSVAGTGIVVAAVLFAQPRVLASWALILAPFVVAEIATALRSAWRRGGASRRRARRALFVGLGAIAAVAAVGFAYVVVVLGLFERPLGDRLSGPQAAATQSILDGVWQVISQSWPTGTGSIAAPAVLLALAVLAGAVIALRTRGLRWVVVSYALLALLFVLAAGSDDVISKLATALWYKDRFRLSSALPVLGVVLATAGILATSALLRRWRKRADPDRGLLLPSVLAGAVAVSSGAVLAFTGATAAISDVFRMPADHADFAVVSRAQIDFMSRLPAIVPEGQRVLGDPWDGSALTLLYGDREPVFPHVNGQWDQDRLILAYRLQSIETDPAVCEALDRLSVRFVLYNPHTFGGGDPSGNHFVAVRAAVDDGLFTEVATDGESTLYRIDQCGPLLDSTP